MSHNLRALREFIVQSFDDQELTEFCLDNFGEVVDRYFGEGVAIGRKALELVAYCERRGLLDSLVARVKAERPGMFIEYEARLQSGKEGVLCSEGSSTMSAGLESVPSALKGGRKAGSEQPNMFEPLGDAGPSDAYSRYEIGVLRLLGRMDRVHPRYTETLVYQQRLTENIERSRLYGETADRRSERAEITQQLTTISLSVLGVTFWELSTLS